MMPDARPRNRHRINLGEETTDTLRHGSDVGSDVKTLKVEMDEESLVQ
jgi:hypothetical protein